MIAALDADGIPTRPYFEPIHLQPLYIERFGYRAGRLPRHRADRPDHAAQPPFFTEMAEEQVDYVCERLARRLARLPAAAVHVEPPEPRSPAFDGSGSTLEAHSLVRPLPAAASCASPAAASGPGSSPGPSGRWSGRSSPRPDAPRRGRRGPSAGLVRVRRARDRPEHDEHVRRPRRDGPGDHGHEVCRRDPDQGTRTRQAQYIALFFKVTIASGIGLSAIYLMALPAPGAALPPERAWPPHCGWGSG